MARTNYRSMEDYEDACNFGWKCVRCEEVIYTPAPMTYGEDDWDEPPVHCDEYMQPMEEL